MTKMKNHRPQGVNHGKKFIKEINYILAKLTMTMRNRNGNASNMKSFRMMRVMIDGLFAIFVARSSTFSVQV